METMNDSCVIGNVYDVMDRQTLIV